MNADLQRLGDEYWMFRLASEPTSASPRRIHDVDTELEDLSLQTKDEHIAAFNGSGSVPMPTMHRHVNEWTASAP